LSASVGGLKVYIQEKGGGWYKRRIRRLFNLGKCIGTARGRGG